MPRVHPAAIVDPRAELASDVVVGPYAIVEADAVLAAGCVLHPHAIVRSFAALGSGTVVHPFAVIGGEAQAKGGVPGPSWVEVGEGNVFREHVTVHGGTEGRATRIGAKNLFMVGAHVAHDVAIGSHCVLANYVQLAGHVVVGDWVTFGGLSGVAQRVRIGEGAFVAAGSGCERDVPPFVVVQGDRARVRGVNVVGLKRRSVPQASIRSLKRAVHALWSSGSHYADALSALADVADPYVQRLATELRSRGAPP
ncbi:MAG TPA: acyl-ACP--UDP-N-acetylglucosamine O-acyltransferase [Polyangiaceae bacterium]|nr:acyl-ACP--UDP-N-acetylglucosamine O-acyltransferase [Polyangiaceae bacterium]